jgi:hypothetical protein
VQNARKIILRSSAFIFLSLLVLFWLLPWKYGHTIGNDYILFPISDQLTLFFSISKHSFPLFIPGFMRGQTASALTLGQLYHPITWLSWLTPGYWNGDALVINTMWRVLSLGVAQYFLYRFFRKLSAEPEWAFICSFIAVYNLRMLDNFRYGASLENYTGFLFSCVCLGYVWLEPHKRRYLLLLIISLCWMICGGHPQMAYYGLMGIFIFAMFCPFICTAMQEQPRPALSVATSYYMRCGACLILGAGLAAAYVVPFYFDFMLTNGVRVNQDYRSSLLFNDNLLGTFNSFLFPLRSDVHGNFGGSSLIMIVLAMPLLGMMLPSRRILFLALSAVVALTILYMPGGTLVHRIAWEILPFAHSYRTPGRISLYLPVLIATMMLLLWKQRDAIPRARLFWSVVGITLAYEAYTLWVIYTDPYYSTFTPLRIRHISLDAQVGSQLLGILSLTVLALWIEHPHRKILGKILCLLVAFNVTTTLSLGTWAANTPQTRNIATMDALTKHALNPPNNGWVAFGMGTFDEYIFNQHVQQVNMSCPNIKPYQEPKLAVLYPTAEPVSDREDFFKKFNSLCNRNTLAIEGAPPPAASTGTAPFSASVNLTYSSFNRLVFHVHTDRAAYAVFSHPFSSHWYASINQQTVPTYRANGFYLATLVPAGDSVVELSYWSEAQFIGMLISCLTALLLLFAAAYRAKNSKGYPAYGIGVLAVCALFGFWLYSLYNGVNFGTDYTWNTAGPLQH